MGPGTFTIGEAAARAGVTADTIRYYERIGLLPKAPRSASGYRRYSDASVARIVLVRNAARFGFGLKQLAGFLRARESGTPPCRAVKASAERLLEEIDRQIATLTEARASIAATVSDWEHRLERTSKGARAYLLDTLVPR
jgi:MerR family transcriptional regulator, copper efflux regulator